MSDKISPAMVFQLRGLTTQTGESGSTVRPTRPARVWRLEPGPNRVGSDTDNEIQLKARGVSRFHAVIHCGAQGCELEDLESKNGTRVNSRRVRRQALTSADIIAFGDSRWWLDVLPETDVELALDFRDDLGPDTTVLDPTRTRESRGSGGLPLPVLKALLDRLRQHPTADVAGALIEVASYLAAAGACWVEWPSGGPATVIAAAGHVGSIPEPEDFAEAHSVEGVSNLYWQMIGDNGLLFLRRPIELHDAKARGLGPGLAIFGTARGPLPAEALAPAWHSELELIAACFLLLEDVEALSLDPKPDDTPGYRREGLRLAGNIVVATSGRMSRIYSQVVQIADDRVPVLITGETGVGKEHVARALHESSCRHDEPFVAVNCSAIPSELLEAEMFGIGYGVATGVKARRGKVREADGGTLFLDEIGDMPSPLQAKLLRVLQEGEVTPVGEGPVKVEVRVVSASHADLPAAIEARQFRHDLYYRLAGYVLRVPALRERRDDLPQLLSSFLRRFGSETQRRVHGVTVKALDHLMHYAWPGNIRQLEHVARRLVYICPSRQPVSSSMVHEALDMLSLPAEHRAGNFALGSEGLQDYLSAIEAEILRQALESTENNQSKAAKLLQISRNSLARRVERLGLHPSQG